MSTLRTLVARPLAAFLVAAVVSMSFAVELYFALLWPMADALGSASARLKWTAYDWMYRFFFSDLQIAAWVGLFVAFPVFAIQCWRIINSWIYQHNRRLIIVATPLLFFTGCALVYSLMPITWQLLPEFETIGTLVDGHPPQAWGGLAQYAKFTLKLMLAAGILFQFPLLLMLAKPGAR